MMLRNKKGFIQNLIFKLVIIVVLFFLIRWLYSIIVISLLPIIAGNLWLLLIIIPIAYLLIRFGIWPLIQTLWGMLA